VDSVGAGKWDKVDEVGEVVDAATTAAVGLGTREEGWGSLRNRRPINTP
jgi:hypothetical protein